MELEHLGRLAERLQEVYDKLQSHPGLWEDISPLLPQGTNKPGLNEEVSRTDTTTVQRHLEIARNKAQAPPRLALVGPFSSGKTTTLNAIMREAAFDRLCRRHLGSTGLALNVGDQPTTGNITEIQFVGQPTAPLAPGVSATPMDSAAPTPGEADPALFEFEVEFLSEDELRSLFEYFNQRMGLGLAPSYFRTAGWLDRLSELDPRLGECFAKPGNTYHKESCLIVWEMVESLRNPAYRPLLGKKRSLGQGEKGLAEFTRLNSRPGLKVPGSWAEKKRDSERKEEAHKVKEFHLVKILRFKLTHPMFQDTPTFSLFDFPGLGAGIARDEGVSRDFIAEANVILVLSRPGITGGEAVDHILSSFDDRRAGLPVRDLLQRIYFLLNGQPTNPPQDKTLVEFYKSFLQSVKNQFGKILDYRNVRDADRPDLLRTFLHHFLACDSMVANLLLTRDQGVKADTGRREYQDRVEKGYFDCPADPALLQQLAADPSLTSQANGYPELARLLADDAVSGEIARIFAHLKKNAGMDNLIAQIKQFVRSEAPRVQTEDVLQHLRAAARPLAPLRGLPAASSAPGLGNVNAVKVKQQYEVGLAFEENWALVLDVWVNGGRDSFAGREEEARLNKWLDQLDEAQAALGGRIDRQVDELITARKLDDFCRDLPAASDGLLPWIKGLLTSGSDPFDPFAGEEDPDDRMLKLPEPHTLLLYRFALACRKELLKYLYDSALPSFVNEVAAVYGDGAGAWQGFNKVWAAMAQFAEPREKDVDTRLCDFRNKNKLADQFLTQGPGLTGTRDWFPRQTLEALLPRGQGPTCGGKFFADHLIEGVKVRVQNWPPLESLPSNSRQLSVLLVRLKLVEGVQSTDGQKRKAPELPELDRPLIVRILRSVGLLDAATPEDELKFAPPDADYWHLPLPQLTGKFHQEDAGVLLWNPLPFDPLLGPVEDSRPGNPSVAPPWVEMLRKHFRELFCDLADRAAVCWKKSYRESYQTGLTRLLRRVGQTDHAVWQWLAERGNVLTGRNPLAAARDNLIAAIDELVRAGLLSSS